MVSQPLLSLIYYAGLDLQETQSLEPLNPRSHSESEGQLCQSWSPWETRGMANRLIEESLEKKHK